MSTAKKVFPAVAGIGGASLLIAFFMLTRPPAPPSAAPASAATSSSTAAAPSDTLAAGESLYRIMAGESKAEFVVDETLRGEPFTVVGATGDVAGEIVLNGEDLARSRVAAVRVNARTLKTDSDRRDGAIGRMILRSGDPANEFITFSPTRLEGLPKTAEPDKEFSFTIVGDLTIAGETRQASFAAAARLVPDGALVASAKTVINYKDFGLTIPKVPFVAWVSDDVALKINLVAKKTE